MSSLGGQAGLPIAAGEKPTQRTAPAAFQELNVENQLTQAFEMIEALSAAVLAAPQAAANPVFKQLVDQIQAKKAELMTMELPKPPTPSDIQALRDFRFPPIEIPQPVSAAPEEFKPIDAEKVGQQLLIELGLLNQPKGKAGAMPAKRPTADEPQLTPKTREIQEMLKKKGLWK